MSLLQRPPLDVHASIYCGTREEAIYDTTLRLLERANSAAPYAGAVVRNVLSAAHVASFQDLDPLDFRAVRPESIAAVQEVTKLVHQATDAWWQESPNRSGFSITEPKATRAFKGSNTPTHTYQNLTKPGWGSDRFTQAPETGPITQLINLRGEDNYSLAIRKWDMFSEEGQAKFTKLYRKGVVLMLRTSDVHLEAGDMLLVTNTPPTILNGSASEDRITVSFSSQLVRTTNNR